jgi:hypothetical protein
VGLIRLAVDFEHPGRAWWDSGGRELWEAITEGFGENAVILDAGVAESWLAEARRVRGWEDGPEHAPHPIAAGPVEGDLQWEE